MRGRKGKSGRGNKRVLLINTSVGNCVFVCILAPALSLPLLLCLAFFRLPFPHLSEAQFDFLPDKATPRARTLPPSFSLFLPLLVP